MFYLNQFFKSILRAHILGVLFVFMTILLISVTMNRHYITNMIDQVDDQSHRPYFNALISKNINLNSISRKLNSLPGVEKVKITKKIDAKKEFSNLSLKSKVLKRLQSMNYSSLTVELNQNIQNKSKKLVREYLARLVGKKSLTLSKIKYPIQEQRVETLKDKVLSYSDLIVIVILSLVWSFLFSYIVKRNNPYFYLLEKFQRRKEVRLKSLSFGTLILFGLTVLFNIYVSEYSSVTSLIYIVSLFSISLFIVYKVKFKGVIS